MTDPRPALWLLLGLFSALVLASLPARAAEEILSYHSRIEVLPSGDLDVTETIEVRAEGRAIKRGIYRDFPTRYRGPQGTLSTTSFEVQSVLKDDRPAPWFTKREGPGVRLYIGSKNQMLSPGVYRYQISYRTERQLKFLKERDELYFNAIAHEWAFPIRKATAAVVLPVGAVADRVTAYTGPIGSDASNTSISREPDLVFFRADGPLMPGEGMTVVVDWPAGIVYRPTTLDRFRYFLTDNAGYLLLMVGLVLVGAYYMVLWNKVGRDPLSGPIIALYEPPLDISAGASRYLLRQSYDDTAFTAAIIALGVKGAIRLEEPKTGEFVIRATASGPTKPLSKGERLIYDKLLAGRQSIAIDKDNHKVLGGAKTAHAKVLETEHHGRHFHRNFGWVALGVALSGFFVFLSLFSLTVFSWPILVLIALLAGLNILFYYLMRKPTLEGRRVMDEIEGFKRYLSVAEADRMNFHNPPDRTPELFEAYLPYAIALDVDHEWGAQFDDVLAAAARERGEEGGWSPVWYSGVGYGRGMPLSSFGSSVGNAFASAFVVAAAAPSSSGSSGFSGGFSGGGGGGGGGGGW